MTISCAESYLPNNSLLATPKYCDIVVVVIIIIVYY